MPVFWSSATMCALPSELAAFPEPEGPPRALGPPGWDANTPEARRAQAKAIWYAEKRRRLAERLAAATADVEAEMDFQWDFWEDVLC